MGRKAYAITERLDGKVAVVTGGSSGIGKWNVRQLAAAGAHVFVFARNKQKTLPIVEEISTATGNKNVEFVQADLMSLKSVKAAAEAFLARNLPLHILICNAGSGMNNGLTHDGYEHLFGQNYLSHFLLTMLLLPKLKETASLLQKQPGCVRIVNVSSRASLRASKIDFEALKTVSTVPFYRLGEGAYGRSKLAQVLSTKKLAQELNGSGISVYSLHPGVVATDIWRDIPSFAAYLLKFLMITEEEGSLTTLYCATSPACASESGFYYDDCTKTEPNPLWNDEEQVNGLWTKSLEFIKDFYGVEATN